MVPSRAITAGPRHHWFGYYDKLQFDPSARYALGMEADFEHRAPTPEDVIRIGMVDLADGDRWIELGESRAWGWQAGSMLQWLPQSAHEIIWNDRVDDLFVSYIFNIETGQKADAAPADFHPQPEWPQRAVHRLPSPRRYAPRLRLHGHPRSLVRCDGTGGDRHTHGRPPNLRNAS